MAAIQTCRRHCLHGGERAIRIIGHFDNLRDGITGRKNAAHARGDEEIAHTHIGILRQMVETQLINPTGARGDGAQPIAIDLHRQGMVGIGDQQDRRRERVGNHHLPHHCIRIEDWLAYIDTRDSALVNQDLLPIRIELDL